MKRWFRKQQAVSDEAVAEQVRAKLGMLARHPDLIDVSVHHGDVTLRGPIAADEIDYLSKIIARVAGVQKLRNLLKVYGTEEDFPAPNERQDAPPAQQQRADPPVESSSASVIEPGSEKNSRSLWTAGLAVIATALCMKAVSRLGRVGAVKFRNKKSARIAPIEQKEDSTCPH
jgi:hypothetical protein